MTRRVPDDPDELERQMEAARLDFEHWRLSRRRSRFDPARTEEDDRLDDPWHGQAESINKGY